MNSEHLSPKTRELLDRPMEERIAHIQKDSWIKDRLERLCCSQRRQSIRFAKEDRRLENRRLHKPLRPMADHN